MRSSPRFVLAGLALALLVALVAMPAPSARVLADDAVRIDAPADGSSVSGRIEIRGRATTADPSRFSFYRLHYGSGSAPASFRPIGNPGEQPVTDGVLGVWDTTPLLTGDYTILLTVYDTAGATATASVVVTVLPAPTPTPQLRQPPLVVVTANPTDTTDDSDPTPTPIPELPQLVPQIPQIDVPPQDAPPPPIRPVDSQPADSGLQPIPITGPNQRPSSFPPPGAAPPADFGIPPTVDTGSGSSPLAPINPVGAPPPPVVAPYEPPPAAPTIVPPTPLGIPP